MSLRAMVRNRPETYFNDYGGKSQELRQETMPHGILTEHIRRGEGSLGPLSKEGVVDIYYELAASPPNPPQYTEWIDMMVVTRHSEGVEVHVRFDIIECKLDQMGSGKAQPFDKQVSQLMKCVDFLATNWCGGDYGAVRAFYIARSYSKNARKKIKASKEQGHVTTRHYVLNPEEEQPTRTWDELTYLVYSWYQEEGVLMLERLDV